MLGDDRLAHVEGGVAVSVLRDRIVNQAGIGSAPRLAVGVLPATPMIMPLAHVQYGSDEVALYGTLHPLVTADGATIPAHSEAYIANPVPAPVVPSGRP